MAMILDSIRIKVGMSLNQHLHNFLVFIIICHIIIIIIDPFSIKFNLICGQFIENFIIIQVILELDDGQVSGYDGCIDYTL